MINNVLLNNWSLISVVNPLFGCNGFGQSWPHVGLRISRTDPIDNIYIYIYIYILKITYSLIQLYSINFWHKFMIFILNKLPQFLFILLKPV